MVNLDCKTNSFALVVNYDFTDKRIDLLNQLNIYLKDNCTEYFYILHDKDILTDGSLKTKHLHVLYKTNKRVRLRTELFRFVDNVFHDATKTKLVSIDKWVDYTKGIQYLIHKNDSAKYQYNETDICTNISRTELSSIIQLTGDTRIDIDYLISLVLDSHSLSEVYLKLGIVYSKMYRQIICDIYRDKENGSLWVL